jgi:glycosyltransferase involved in cell wall biosynthesis
MTEQSPKRPITVTHIISGDLWAGAEVQVYNLCKALNNTQEIAVTSVVFNPGILHDKLAELGIPVTLADESSTGPLGIARRIAAHCRAQGTDIVHTHGFKENVLGIAGKELARVRYSVRTVHGNPEHKLSFKKPHKWLINRLDIWLGRARQQAVIAVSSQLEQALEPLFPGKVHKIFNFIDVQELRNTWLPRPERTSTQLQLGIVGRLVPVKRVDLFIRIIHQLSQQGVDCKGIILGDGPLKPELQNLCASLRIEQRIDFRGFVDPVAKEMLKLDALIMTSDHEGLPMTLLEALALELPVYAHDTGGISEVLRNGDFGVLVEEQKETSFAEAIEKSEFRRMHVSPETKAIEHLKSNFDKVAAADRYTILYARITNKPDASPRTAD